MSEVLEGATTPEVAVEQSGLPSDVAENVSVKDGFTSVADEQFGENGRFRGRWNNPAEMADFIENLETKHSNMGREVADAKKAQVAEVETMANEAQTQQMQSDLVKSLVPEFIGNGMVVTDEMNQQLSEAGLTQDQIKIGAYELKEAQATNAGYVGGKENYDIIMDYHAKEMSDEQKVKFNHSIEDPNNSEALMVGLQTMYEKSLGAVESTDRVRGNVAPTNSVKPYENRADLFRDKTYADSTSSNKYDKARYKARLAITPSEVYL